MKLEAAKFEGNPVTELPNYRAHVLHLLGPSVQTLDNSPVSAAEFHSAANCVTLEATVMPLMVSNACLEHKLGKVVQLTRLHCELQCVVLRGQCDGSADLHQGTTVGNSRMFLKLWDYEGSLNNQV